MDLPLPDLPLPDLPLPDLPLPDLPLPDLAATERLGALLAGLLRAGDAVLLDGPLGAGKSALARALLRAALSDQTLEVPSPSYTLVQSYQAPGLLIHHLDLWRLDGPAGLHELGWEELREGVVLVEWPDRLGPLTPAGALSVSLQQGAAPGARLARLQGWPDRLARPVVL